jgi:hypothetical protein
MIDQVAASPRDVRAFSGRTLHTVIDEDALNGKMLQIFTNGDTAKSLAQSASKGASSLPRARAPKPESGTAALRQTLTPGVPLDGGYLELYEHVEFDGCSWRLIEYDNHVVGNYGNLWACGFLWWNRKNAENKVSSLDILISADYAIFFDATDLDSGDFSNTLWMPGNSWVPSLVPFGWNDRISSHMLWYLQPGPGTS